MSKIAIITDTHFGARNDSPIFEEYFYKFFEDIFFPYLKLNRIEHLLHLGDVFDRRKFINIKTLHSFRTSFIRSLEENGIMMFSIPGNHDTFHRNTNRVNSQSEFLDHERNVIVLEEARKLEFDGVTFSMLPWICEENQESCFEYLKSDDADILCGHMEINGFKPYRNSPAFEHGIDQDIFDKYDAVLTGHFHHKSSNGNIHYLGSPYQIISSDGGDSRGFHTFDTKTRELEFVRNPFVMFTTVNYDDQNKNLARVLEQLQPLEQFTNTFVKVNVVHQSNPFYFDNFITLLKQAAPHNYNVVNHVDESDVIQTEIEVKDTSTLIQNCVDDLDTSLDKNRLKSKIMELYAAASSADVTVW